MCYNHVVKAIRNKLLDANLTADIQEEIIADIEEIHTCTTEVLFDKAVTIFIKKWESRNATELLKYLKNQWFSSPKNWFLGFGNGVSTNKGIKSFYNKLKRPVALYKRMDLKDFLGKLKLFMSKISEETAYKNRLLSAPFGQKDGKGQPKMVASASALLID